MGGYRVYGNTSSECSLNDHVERETLGVHGVRVVELDDMVVHEQPTNIKRAKTNKAEVAVRTTAVWPPLVRTGTGNMAVWPPIVPTPLPSRKPWEFIGPWRPRLTISSNRIFTDVDNAGMFR